MPKVETYPVGKKLLMV